MKFNVSKEGFLKFKFQRDRFFPLGSHLRQEVSAPWAGNLSATMASAISARRQQVVIEKAYKVRDVVPFQHNFFAL